MADIIDLEVIRSIKNEAGSNVSNTEEKSIPKSGLKRLQERLNFDENKVISFAHSIDALIQKRQSKFEEYERYYYTGTNESSPLALKRLYGELNFIKSLIFTPDRLIIKPIVVEELTPLQRSLLELLVKRVKDNFYTFFRLDREINEAVLQALIYGYAPIKVFYYGDGVLYKTISPYNFGVLYESLDIDDRQQVILHKTYLTREKILVDFGIDIDKELALRESIKNVKQTSSLEIWPISSQKGVFYSEPDVDTWYNPENGAELYPIWEIYLNEFYYLGTKKDVWHRIVYLPQIRKIIFTEPQKTYRHPFFIIRAHRLLNSVYGLSLIELLKEVQEQRIKCLQEIERLTALRTHPPFIINSGQVNVNTIEEDIKKLVTPNGYVIIPDPNSRIDKFIPETGLQELYTKLDYWNNQVKYISGLFEIVMGETVKAPKGTGEILATFASSIFRDLSHEIQTTLEQIFTFTAHLFMLYCDEKFKIEDKQYTFGDFPFFVRFEIESHSGSPIKLRETKELILFLFKMGSIPADIIFKVFDLPFYDEYKTYQKMLAETQLLKDIKQQKKKKEEETE
ncbi:MAG: hypothetical protein ACK4GE_05095 [Caldimicrobium sp.]